MEDLLQYLGQAITLAEKHWPGLAWFVCAMMFGQVMAHRVFTREQAAKVRKSQWFWWWARKTLALHGVIAGNILGMIWRDPLGTPWPVVASMAYFGLWGGLSVTGYEVIKGLLKKRGIDINLPGGDTPSYIPPRMPPSIPPDLSDEDVKEDS